MNHVVSTGDRGLKQEFNETFFRNLKHLFYTVNITSFVINKPKSFEKRVPTHILTKSATVSSKCYQPIRCKRVL